jgi:hypothetical protein
MPEASGFASIAQIRIRGGYELLGQIVRLQVQTSPLKQGEKPHRWYDPAPIRTVRQLRLDAGGVTGIDDLTGEPVADVHHRDHPLSRFRGENGVSLGFTSHYGLMRDRFGDHLVDGIAGESILIATERRIPADLLTEGVTIMTANGTIAIDDVKVAAPCVEFSKFALQFPPQQPADAHVTGAVQFLHHGMRGYYGTTGNITGDAVVSTGDLVYLREW